ncbi:unnamed protein product [Camellia sinensis]
MNLFTVLVGALNDRLSLANPTDKSETKKKVEIKSCLIGLLEPLLIGFATKQQSFEQKLDLSEILYQITSGFSFPLLAGMFVLSHILLLWILNTCWILLSFSFLLFGL